MNPLILYSALGSLAVGLITGWVVRDWKADADQVAAYEKSNKLLAEMQQKMDNIAFGYELERSQAESNSIVRQTELRTIYRDVPINTDCAAPDSARGLLENGVYEANARISGKSIEPVPAATTSPQSAR